jgi:CBS-domain-containing membrane protein
MSEQEYDIVESKNWQPRVIVVGAVLGALVGMSAAYLLIKSNEQEGPPQISAGEGVKLGVLVLGLLRSVSSLGE